MTWPDKIHANQWRRLLAHAGLVLIALVLLLAASKLYVFRPSFGLKVTYFRGTNFEEKICSRTEPAVCRDYGNQAPAWRVPAENFSALWEGILRVPETGEYLFFSQNDDGLRLIIDGQNVIDNWRDQSWETSALGSKVHLAAGDHRIMVEHYSREGEAALRIKWCGGPIPPNTVLSAPFLIPRASRYLDASALGLVLAGIILKVVLLFSALILPGYCILRLFFGERMDSDLAFLLAAPATIVLLGLIFAALFSLNAPGWAHQLAYALVIMAVLLMLIIRKVWKDSFNLSGACKTGLLFAFLSALISVCFVAAVGHIHPAVAIQEWMDAARRNPAFPMGADNGIQYYAGLTFARHLDPDAFSQSWAADFWKISDRPPLLGILYAIDLLATGSVSNPWYWNYEILGVVLNSFYLIPFYLLFARLFRDRRLAGWIAAAVMFNTFVFINTWYIWPKLMAMYFILTAVFYVLARDDFRWRAALVAGICCGLAALSHGSAALSLPALMLYQGVALWRRDKSFRRVFAIGGLIAVFTAAFFAIQLPWEIYKARHSPDRNVLVKLHYFTKYTDEDVNPDSINKFLTAPLSDWITAFFQSTPPKEQCQHRLSNLAAGLRVNGLAELAKALRSGDWDSYFKSSYKLQFLHPLAVIGPLNIVFGVLFLAILFVRRFLFSAKIRFTVAADMPRLMILLSFAAVSLVFNILLKWSAPMNHELPYLELVLIMALMTGFAFSLHPAVRITLLAFIGLQFFHFVRFAQLARGYSVFNFFSIAMLAAVVAVLLVPLFLRAKHPPPAAADGCI